jgi:hypothetical protein
MDLDCRKLLQTLAARTLVVAQRCDDRRIQFRLVEIANEYIDMMIGLHHRGGRTDQHPRPN